MSRIYLDWNATTPPSREVVDAMRDAALEAWANPASVHGDGRAARALVEDARQAVADLARADPRDVVFVSGGTEANNLAMRSALPAGSRGRLLASRIEHPSIVATAEALEREGRADVRWLGVTPGGHLDVSDVARAASEGPVHLACIQAVNHETGAVQPLAEIHARLPPETWLHVDAVQAWGKVEFAAKLATTLTLAAHKLRGPKGIGALVTRPCVRLTPLLRGGAQERGLRPGTLDPVAARGLAVAVRAATGAHERHAALADLRDRFEAWVLELAPNAVVNGAAPRAPHVTNVSVPGWRGPELVAALDLEGVSASSGSACSAGTAEPSPVIEAIAGRARAESAVRFSIGELTTLDDLAKARAILARVLCR
jgi:cysteine desulfurase